MIYSRESDAHGQKITPPLERLQRIVESGRPGDEEREHVANQLITQDQLGRLDPRLKKLAQLKPSRPRKAPPSAREILSHRAKSKEPFKPATGRTEHHRH